MPVVVTIDVEFGDRPTADPLRTLDELVRVLDDHGAPATFFVQGRWAKAHPLLVADLAARDVTLGLHGYTHVDYRRLTDAGVRAELADGLAALRAAAPDHVVRYTRLPHGYGTDEPRIRAAIEEAELVPVGWDYSTFDWDEDLPIDRRTLRASAAVERGGVVLMHSWPAQTPRILAHLLAAAAAAAAAAASPGPVAGGPGATRSGGGGGVVSLDDVELPGRQPNGRTMHVERTDPPR